MRDFRNTQAWHKAHALVLQTYRVTRSFPADERFNLTSQVRRAALSIPTSIAEGCGRETDRELARFLQIAAGSASELEYLMLAARDLSYIDAEAHGSLDISVNEVKKMLNAFVRSLRVSANKANG
jgi:four helix bundle protein